MSKIEDLVGRAGDPLARLFQTTGGQKIADRLAGYVFRMDYERALVITNDYYREEVKGIPQNSFLLACAFNPEQLSQVPVHQRFVILLRVLGPGRLPQESEYTAALIQHFQDKTERGVSADRDGIDEYTHAQLQHGALECLILGSFYAEGTKLCYGADVEDFVSASLISVYKPHDEALSAIVNYCDPARLEKSRDDALEQGFETVPAPFTIGAVRYTSTRRMQNSDHTAIPVSFETVDLLAKRTGVFGMTRTGKSNLVKTMISAVQNSVMAAHGRVGQLILDLNGEYANANAQDRGAISEVFDGNVVRYRGVLTPGFYDMRPNFYQSYGIGFSTLQAALRSDGSLQGADMNALKEMELGGQPTDYGERQRWEVKIAAYRCLLHVARFEPGDGDDRVKFKIGKDTASNAYQALQMDTGATNKDARAAAFFEKYGDPSAGMSLDDAFQLFRELRKAHKTELEQNGIGLLSSSGNAWLEPETIALLNLAVGQNLAGTMIKGRNTVANFRREHSPTGSAEVDQDIYEHLANGRIVIVDLSVGHPAVRVQMMERIAGGIFSRSFGIFSGGTTPPPILIYVEEAHNHIGPKAEPDDTWPRIAKEGAKANIGLIYATQEPSSIQKNILSNTENILSSHLNNDDEIKALSKYYDFGDFATSIKRAQDVGFIRMKRLSAPFVLPVQVTKFEPEPIRQKFLGLLPKGFELAPTPRTRVKAPSAAEIPDMFS